MAWFRNFYKCDRCKREWTDEWSATCDDDCPHCGMRHMSPYRSEDIPAPKKVRSVKPATIRNDIQLRIVVESLKTARDSAKSAGCPQTLKKIRSALKSAEGAQRHMERRLTEGVAS